MKIVYILITFFMLSEHKNIWGFAEEFPAEHTVIPINHSTPENSFYTLNDKEGKIAASFSVKDTNAQTLEGSILHLPISKSTNISALVDNISTQLPIPLTLAERSLLTKALNKVKNGESWDYVNAQLENIYKIPGRTKINEEKLIQALQNAEKTNGTISEIFNRIISSLKTQIGHIMTLSSNELSTRHTGSSITFSDTASKKITDSQQAKTEEKKTPDKKLSPPINIPESSFQSIQPETPKNPADNNNNLTDQVTAIIQKIKTPDDAKKMANIPKKTSNKDSQRLVRELLEIVCSLESKEHSFNKQTPQNNDSLLNLICPAQTTKAKQSSEDDLKTINALLKQYGLPQITKNMNPILAEIIKNSLLEILSKINETLSQAEDDVPADYQQEEETPEPEVIE